MKAISAAIIVLAGATLATSNDVLIREALGYPIGILGLVSWLYAFYLKKD